MQGLGNRRTALECHLPLVPVVVDQAAGSHQPPLADRQSFAEASPAGVVLSTVRPLADGRPLELRLYETLGRPTDAVIRLGRPFQKAVETDFLGRATDALEQIEVRHGAIHLRLAPWKIVTLRVE